MLNYTQFESLILNPALNALQLSSLSLVVAGTIAHESVGGTYIKQLSGPALGIAQMEPATHDSIWQSYLPHNVALTHHLMTMCSFARAPKASQLINDLLYATAMCAILYKWRLESHKQSMPTTIEQAADYWKLYYNTLNGKGTVEQFINDYRQWCGQPATGKPASSKSKRAA